MSGRIWFTKLPFGILLLFALFFLDEIPCKVELDNPVY